MGGCFSSALKGQKIRTYAALYKNEKLPESIRKRMFTAMIRAELPVWERAQDTLKLRIKRSDNIIADKNRELEDLASTELMIMNNIKRMNPGRYNTLVMERIDTEWRETFLPRYKRLAADIKAETARRTINAARMHNASEKVTKFQTAIDTTEGDEGMPSNETAEMLFGLMNNDFEPVTSETIVNSAGPEEKKFGKTVEKSTELVPLINGGSSDKTMSEDDMLIEKLMKQMGLNPGTESVQGSGSESRREDESKSSVRRIGMIESENY